MYPSSWRARRRPHIFKTNILQQVLEDLEVLFKKELIKDYDVSSDFALYLRGLKPELEKFHLQINNRKGDVRMPYFKTQTQIVYALRYFHAYWFQIKHALDEIKEHLMKKNELKIGLFCAGPCPELIGISRFLEENPNNFSSVDIHIYDQIDEWKYARKNFIFSNGKKKLMEKNLRMNFHFHQIDLTSPDDLDQFITSNFFDVISFQNCLGEFSESSLDNSSKNFLKVLESLKPNSHAIFSERDIIGTHKNISRILKFSASNNYRIISNEDEAHVYDSKVHSPVPDELKYGNFYRDPNHNSEGRSAMRRNSYKLLILQKFLELQKNQDPGMPIFDLPNDWYPYHHEELYHLSYGWGRVVDIQNHPNITVVVEFRNKRYGFYAPFEELKTDLKNKSLIGRAAIHRDFGKGVVKAIDDRSIEVDFDELGLVSLTLPSTRMRIE